MGRLKYCKMYGCNADSSFWLCSCKTNRLITLIAGACYLIFENDIKYLFDKNVAKEQKNKIC